MTTSLTALVAEQHRTDLLAEADNYRRTHRVRQLRDETAPRAFRAFKKDVATAQL